MELAAEKSRWIYIAKKDYVLAQERSKTGDDALRNLSMAKTYYTAAKPYLALEHVEVIKKYLHIK